MDDLRQRFATLDAVPVPDVWSEVERRIEALGGAAPTGRLQVVRPEWRAGRSEPVHPRATPRGRRETALVAAAAALAVVLVAGGLAVGSGLVRLPSVVLPSNSQPPVGSPEASPSAAEVTPGPSVPAPSAAPVGLPATPGMFASVKEWRPVSATVGWVATSTALYRTPDRGTTWSDVGPLSVTATTIAFVDPDTTYVASGGTSSTIAATHDGGRSWVEAALNTGAISGGPVFTFRSPLRGFATFYDLAGGPALRVFATADGGVTWTGPTAGSVPPLPGSFDKLDDPLGGFLTQRSGKFDNKPFDNRFYLSADGAMSWTDSRFPTGPLAPKDALKEIVDIVQDDGGPITMAITVDGGADAVYESTDDPASWRLVRKLPGPDVQLLSPTTWVVATTPTEFRSTVDAGEHWRTTASSTRFRQLPRFATPDDAWLVVGCNPDSILPQEPHCDGTIRETIFLVTSDGGATWNRVDQR